jgi:hypothetical protein
MITSANQASSKATATPINRSSHQTPVTARPPATAAGAPAGGQFGHVGIARPAGLVERVRDQASLATGYANRRSGPKWRQTGMVGRCWGPPALSRTIPTEVLRRDR